MNSDNSSLEHNFDSTSSINNTLIPRVGYDTGNGESLAQETLTIAQVWGWAFLFVTIINLSSVMGIIFFPLMKKSFYTVIMRAMIGLAIGSLSGSSLFHLIPAAFDLHESNDKGQSYINIAVFIWSSMWLVMLLECTIKIVVKMRAAKSLRKFEDEDSSAHLRNNNHNNLEGQLKQSSQQSLAIANGDIHNMQIDEISDDSGGEDETPTATDTTHSLKTSQSNLPVYRSTFSLNKRAMEVLGENPSNPEAIKTVAWLIIIGDSLHNFIDGISIGAGFVKDFRTGSIISLAIMCEEFPHELGDFAILINSGFSVKKALVVNFLSALTCYLGMGLGILLGEIEWANYIFAFAAGIFLYVSLADMIPEITTLIEEVSDISPRKAWIVLLTHNVGILVGISILYMLAAFQPQ